MILVTGSAGLIGSSVSKYFISKKEEVIGIDNDQRKKFFGNNGSVEKEIYNLKKLKKFKHFNINILNNNRLERLFKK